LHIFKMCKIQ